MIEALKQLPTHATTEVHRVFSAFPLTFKSERRLPKTVLDKNKTATIGLKSHDVGIQHRSMQKKMTNFIFPGDFGLRNPVIHKPFSPKKGIRLS